VGRDVTVGESLAVDFDEGLTDSNCNVQHRHQMVGLVLQVLQGIALVDVFHDYVRVQSVLANPQHFHNVWVFKSPIV
jgi:hypothetical protein